MNEIEYDKHILVAYSILDNSKLIIKTNYLNYFALNKTILPNILDIFLIFDIF